MIRKLNILLLIGLAALLIWQRYSDELTPADRKLLFVGNSYIFFYDVPTQIKRLAASVPEPVHYHTKLIAKPSYTLEQHLTEENVLSELQSDVWDVAVIQDLSSTTFTRKGRERMRRSVARLVDASSETQQLLYAHWPPDSVPPAERSWAIANIEASYRQIAVDHDASVARIGAAWQAAWEAGISELYHPDGHHASAKGAYLAALVVLAFLGDVDVSQTTWTPETVSQQEAETMRQIVLTLNPKQ